MHKLIVCDDELTIRQGLMAIIKKKYPKVEIPGSAANGFEAYQMILEHQPDVVLMDINMPGMSGLEVIEKSKIGSPGTKFIIVSGYDEFQYAQKAVQLHAFDYLLKPIDRNKLFETIDRALNLSLQEEINDAQETISSELSLGEDAVHDIYRNYRETDLSLSMLSEKMHVSSSYLSRVIKKETNMSFSEFLTKVRMETAITFLISHPQCSTLKVSEEVGYKSQHYFCKVFRNYTGMTPTDYREKNKSIS
ncbi:MAG: response regulator [Clostridium sp.]|nr:response regulator [Clostridium sp.]